MRSDTRFSRRAQKEERETCASDRITVVRKCLKKMCQGARNDDIFLEIMAEAKEMDFYRFLGWWIMFCGMIIATLDLLHEVFPPGIKVFGTIGILIELLFLVSFIYMFLIRFNTVSVWKKYVLIVLEEEYSKR